MATLTFANDPDGGWKTLHEEAITLLKNKNPKEGLVAAKKALAMVEQASPVDESVVAKNLALVGLLHLMLGQLKEAEQCQERALEMRERVPGPQSVDLVWSLKYLAQVYSLGRTGKYEKVGPLYERALSIQEEAFGHDNLEVAKTLEALGQHYERRMDERKKAEPLYQRALAIRDAVQGSDHLDVAQSLKGLGLYYCNTSDCERAQPLFDRALSILEKNLGPDHADFVTATVELAELSYRNGQYKEAARRLVHVIALRERKTGPDAFENAALLNDLGMVYLAQKEYRKSEEFLARALSMVEKQVGPTSPELESYLDNLARVYRSTNRVKLAEESERRAARLHTARLALPEPEIAGPNCEFKEPPENASQGFYPPHAYPMRLYPVEPGPRYSGCQWIWISYRNKTSWDYRTVTLYENGRPVLYRNTDESFENVTTCKFRDEILIERIDSNPSRFETRGCPTSGRLQANLSVRPKEGKWWDFW